MSYLQRKEALAALTGSSMTRLGLQGIP